MDERLKFVARLLDGEKMAGLCREFGISRKTGYKIFRRYRDYGLDGLTDRSRRPYRQASQLPFRRTGRHTDNHSFLAGGLNASVARRNTAADALASSGGRLCRGASAGRLCRRWHAGRGSDRQAESTRYSNQSSQFRLLLLASSASESRPEIPPERTSPNFASVRSIINRRRRRPS